MENKVSIIIVTYNRLSYLKLTVEAILLQTYKNWELLIIGDGHQQDVNDYVVSLNNPDISYLYVNHCGYPAKGRNLGIEKSSCPFIAFCDDDDLWVYNKLETQMNVILSDSSISLCFTNRNLIDLNGNVIAYNAINLKNSCDLKRLLSTNYITYSSVLLQRKILKDTGVFPDDIIFKAVEDYHLWLRIARLGKIFALDKPLVLYRIHQNNITVQLSKGALKNVPVFKDIFSKFKFRYFDMFKTYLIIYLKVIYYTAKGD